MSYQSLTLKPHTTSKFKSLHNDCHEDLLSLFDDKIDSLLPIRVNIFESNEFRLLRKKSVLQKKHTLQPSLLCQT